MNGNQDLQNQFIGWLSEKLQIQDEGQLKEKLKELGEDGIKQAYDQFLKESTQAQQYKKGGKLEYLKCLQSLKKGGKMEKGCGCGAKMEKGGEVKKKEDKPKFKEFIKKK